MKTLKKPISGIVNRACSINLRMSMNARILPSITMRYFGGSTGEKAASMDDNPHLYDPTYVPCEESDFDVDPLDVRLRQPLPKEVFLPRDEVLKRMIAVLEGMERAKTENVAVTENSHLYNDLGLDSLDQVEFGLALEDEFDIDLPDEEAEQIVTIGDAVELIADHPHAR